MTICGFENYYITTIFSPNKDNNGLNKIIKKIIRHIQVLQEWSRVKKTMGLIINLKEVLINPVKLGGILLGVVEWNDA